MLSSAKDAPEKLILKFQVIQVSEMNIQPDSGTSFNTVLVMIIKSS